MQQCIIMCNVCYDSGYDKCRATCWSLYYDPGVKPAQEINYQRSSETSSNTDREHLDRSHNESCRYLNNECPGGAGQAVHPIKSDSWQLILVSSVHPVCSASWHLRRCSHKWGKWRAGVRDRVTRRFNLLLPLWETDSSLLTSYLNWHPH